MRIRSITCWLVLFVGLGCSARGQEIGDAGSFVPDYFMAGLSTGIVVPTRLPCCYVGFRSSGEQRQAEMFFFMAQIWVKDKHPDEPLTHYRTPGAEQFRIENWPLALALRHFFMDPQDARQADPTAPPTFNIREIVIAEPAQKLSFLAGFYAQCHRKDGDVFNVPASYAVRDVITLFLLEGCEVSDVTQDHAVPSTMTFKVKPTKEAARVFALVDGWQPPTAEWKTK